MPGGRGGREGRPAAGIAKQLPRLGGERGRVGDPVSGAAGDQIPGDGREIPHAWPQNKRTLEGGGLDRRLALRVGRKALAHEDDVGDLRKLAQFPGRVPNRDIDRARGGPAGAEMKPEPARLQELLDLEPALRVAGHEQERARQPLGPGSPQSRDQGFLLAGPGRRAEKNLPFGRQSQLAAKRGELGVSQSRNFDIQLDVARCLQPLRGEPEHGEPAAVPF